MSNELPKLFAGRYRVEAPIAKGGQGAVYRAFDTVRSKHVALKRLHLPASDKRAQRMFEREYHALARLKHPRIIEVYDYGISSDGTFYTMELLDGRDLRDLAPLPFHVACRYLRDVASSLALLHSRNLLHRDLSPRNVRITSADRAKLIDFGTLTSFGRNGLTAGTPPLVPPEALKRAELDQRSDLYQLGALAYWILTGHHAYKARLIPELPEAWRTPPPLPSELAALDARLPAIPPKLDELVMAMLDHNPLARPGSAAEVIARLSAIADLPPDSELLSALSYLRSGGTVGRARVRATLRRGVKQAAAGKGSVFLIEGQSGMGAQRLLGELAVTAQLQSVHAIVVDAANHGEPDAVTRQLAMGLLDVAPEQARAAFGDDAPLLMQLIEAGISSATKADAFDPREARMHAQVGLLGWLERLTLQTPCVLAVRNFQRADKSSAALLAALARTASARSLLLVLAYDPDEPALTAVALQAVQKYATGVRLKGLNRDEVRLLVESTFGEVENTERLASWLHELTGGRPKACRDLMQHLVEHGTARFADGVWVLPQALPASDLPADLGQAMAARLQRLSEPARRTAAVLSVHYGAMSIDHCIELARARGVGAPVKALTELEQHGIVVTVDDRVRFGHRALQRAARDGLSPSEIQELHRLVGALLARSSIQDSRTRLDAGWHLLHGGDEARGADLLAQQGIALSYDANDMPDAIPALRAALDVFRRHGRGKRDLARVLGPLALSGFYTSREVLEQHADEAISTLADALGFSLADRWRSRVGARLSLAVGMLYGITGFMREHGVRLGAHMFHETLALFVAVCGFAKSLGVLTMDGARTRRYNAPIKALLILGKDSGPALAYAFGDALALISEDRMAEVLTRLRSIVARLADPRPIAHLPKSAQLMFHTSALYVLGSVSSFFEDPEALVIADQLEQRGTGLFSLFANQIRANYHAVRGENTLADHYAQAVERFAMQTGSSWQAELWAAPSSVLHCILTGDLVGMQRAVGKLERLSRDIPTLAPSARLALAGYHELRGDVVTADALIESSAATVPRATNSWSVTMAARVRTLTKLGRADEARALGMTVLSHYDAEDRKLATGIAPLVAALALAEAASGAAERGQTRVDAYLAELGERGGPVTRGILHEAAARIAYALGDRAMTAAHLWSMHSHFVPTGNPVLRARYEQFRRELQPEQSSVTRITGRFRRATPQAFEADTVAAELED